MRILGVDPALTVTGYGVIDAEGKNLALLEAGIIKTSPRQPIHLRLGKIHQAVLRLISDTKPEVMVLEKLYAHSRHPTTAFILGQARGVICLTCAQQGIPLVEYGATRVKKAITGRGLASKHQIQRMVTGVLSLGKVPSYTDVTDALALAIAHSYIMRAYR
ncbi:MAG: crossover junction endodeoxyribonuclease RuvC [Candidatus Omnitrophica bacterium]|nr:crossover junction endodeoxyribonuclease RuvC [Candidatus Omnitrophota bacterium]